MNVLVKAYLKNNLGDDLFIKILADTYQDNFTIITATKNKSLNKIENLTIKSNLLIQIPNKIIKKLILNYNPYEMSIKKKNDIIVCIGGSMFIEGNIEKHKKDLQSYTQNYIPYYIIGSNVGPFKTKEYPNLLKEELFKQATDVCFRDKYSKEQFKTLKNTRVTTDIVFNLKTSNYNIKNEKKVIISVIDVTNRFDKSIKESYEKTILDFIEYFTKKDYEVVLMSFCKHEKDENAINRIAKKSSIKVRKHFYRGDIDASLNEIATSSIVIGTRFHANILGLIFNKTIIPISYSRKTTDILNDLNYQGKIIDLKSIKKFNISDLTEKDLTYKLNIDKYKKLADKSFEKLDQILNRK